MRFCTVCQNMHYIRIDSENPNKLIYYCRNCGNEEELTGGMDICISKTQIKKSKKNFNHIINKYTKYDPTLPRVSHILCPNPDCPTNREQNPESREIIYIRHDDVNMKYVYLCTNDTCNYTWRMDDPNV